MQVIKKFFYSIFHFLWRKKWRALVALILLCVIAFFFWKKYFKHKEDVSFVSNDYTVATGDVSIALSLAGTTQFANAQKLTFVNKGRVTSVRTKIGASVKKGDILATITTDDLDKDVEKAKKDLKNRQLKLQKILDKSNKELDILRAQSTYDLLLLQKQTLPSEQLLDIKTKESDIQDLQRQIKDKGNDLQEAEKDYVELLSGKAGATNAELSLSSLVRSRNKTMEGLIRDFRNSANGLQSMLDSYDILMKMTDTYMDSTSSGDVSVYIGAKNQSLLNESKNQFRVVKGYVKKLNDIFSYYSEQQLGQLTENEMLSGYAIYKELGNEMKKWGEINYDMFLESIETFDLSRSTIQSYAKTYGTAFETKGYEYLDKYTDTVDTLAKLKDTDTTVEDSADKVQKLKIELEKLKINLEKKKVELEIEKKKKILESAELDKKIEDAKVDLEKAKDGNAQQDEIESLRNEIDNTQFNLTTLMKKYDEYKIIANFDGIVTKLDMQVGDSIETNNSSSDTQKYIYVETPDLLEVKLDVDQVDIVKIKIGMPVQVYVDAFPESVYTGVFSEIDTMPDSGGEYGGGGSYKAKVVFKKNNPEERILGGMSANVKITLNEVKGAIVVPNPAIVDTEDGQKKVRLQDKNGNWKDQIIETDIADEVNTVVLSGLQVGNVVKGLYITEDSMNALGVGKEEEGAGDIYMGGI